MHEDRRNYRAALKRGLLLKCEKEELSLEKPDCLFEELAS